MSQSIFFLFCLLMTETGSDLQLSESGSDSDDD